MSVYLYMINSICVCGAGTMGSGIAQVAAVAGMQVIQFDVNPAMLQKSKEAIGQNLQLLVSKNKLNSAEAAKAFSLIQFSSEIQQCKADLVIEAIIEQKEAKAGLFNQLSAINMPQTILATNTSSISIKEIAALVPHPERVIGMHFFNPAPLMKLVEVVKIEQTDTAVINAIVSLSQLMGKIPVVCNDSPGFIVNRVARPYYLEAMKMVESGVATIETIDAVMEATGFKMGPFKLMDLIGLDINYSVSTIVWEALGKPERLKPSPIQNQKITSGALGRKSGNGFYCYSL